MCNKDFGCLNQSLLHSDNTVDYQLDGVQAVYLMDSPSANVPGLDSTHGSNEDVPRVKFLCSFLGSILPRPQDGKLRYVGGETRIVSLPRDVTYEELMSRMRELYEGVVVLKYQQPDEDLDALVSVVNDDDVTNMMEEYEKLGSGDGFTRLRIFLFSHLDQDGSNHYVDGDERESERRYVDALNSMNDGNDFSKLQHQESPVISSIDDVYMAERFLNTMNLDGGIHNLPQYNVHHLTVPHMSSGQHQQPVSQRYNEMEGPWSPSYYSPRHYWHHDPPRPLPEFPSSPPSARFRMPFGEERIPEEYVRQHVNHHPTYEPQPQFSEKLAWMPPGTVSGDKNGFPGNLFHGLNVFDGNGVCEHCRLNYRRNQLHLDQSNMGNGLPHIPISCAECHPNRENLILNAEAKLAHGMYPKDNDSRSVYNESHSHERGWVLQHQLNPRVEEARTFMSGAGRLTDHYLVDGPSMNIPPGHSNLVDGHHVSPKHVHHRAGPEMGNELFHDAAAAAAPHLHIPSPEEHVVRYGNYPYGTESIYPVSHGHAPAQTLWRNVQNPMHGASSYEASSSLVNGSINAAYIRGAVEGNSRFLVGVDNQNSWVEPSQRLPGFEGTATPPEYYYSQVQRLNLQNHNQENQLPDLMKQSDSLSALIHDKLVSSTACCSPGSRNNNVSEAGRMDGNCNLGQEKEASRVENVEITDVKTTCPEQNMIAKKSMGSSSFQTIEVSGDIEKSGENGPSASPEDMQLSAHSLSFLPELIASVKRAALEGAEEVKAKVEENNDSVKRDTMPKEAPASESELASIHGELEIDSDNDNVKNSEIEPTMAEAEAIARGLQTIKNDDLEEIRELGSGTYGSVYYGKWRGSDVAIKRIKASCFAGKPSERERLIADFWKEASLLSSLHHPNVVSFYGIVRDGPDGSLATVTEFMVNGSLKQFFQKKDRTIDRRKRLIIAMDAAFGMEYLHGKNIVHFDLKCENLLVNMRDPQRPVCKIGDLGLSKVKQQTLVSGGVRGTIPWMAPELLSGKSHMVTEKIDVYSFGIVMWELLTGDEPYAEMHCASIIGGIVNHTLRPQIPTWCDPEWKSLMESYLCPTR